MTPEMDAGAAAHSAEGSGASRADEGLSLLGRRTEYRSDYAPEVLETFSNKHPDNDYWVRFNCPEFTSLCPDYRTAGFCGNTHKLPA